MDNSDTSEAWYDGREEGRKEKQAEIDEKAKLIYKLEGYIIESEIVIPSEVWDEIAKHGKGE